MRAWSYAIACLSDALIKKCVWQGGVVTPGPSLCACGADERSGEMGVGERTSRLWRAGDLCFFFSFFVHV